MAGLFRDSGTINCLRARLSPFQSGSESDDERSDNRCEIRGSDNDDCPSVAGPVSDNRCSNQERKERPAEKPQTMDEWRQLSRLDPRSRGHFKHQLLAESNENEGTDDSNEGSDQSSWDNHTVDFAVSEGATGRSASSGQGTS